MTRSVNAAGLTNAGRVSVRRGIWWTAALAVLLRALPSAAAALDPTLLDPRSLAMGGATRSLAETQAAARVNPAALNLRRSFFGGVSYATSRAGPLDATQITLIDSVTSPMGGALQYLRLQGDTEREDVSLSLSAGGHGLWWGATGRYVHARARGSTEWDDTITGDMGFLIERPGGIRIGVVGYDLLDTGSLFLERRFALGISRAAATGLTLAGDIVRSVGRDFRDGLDLHLGVEYTPVGSAWAFRAGQAWTSEDAKDFASIGLGWTRGTVQLGYGVRKVRQDPGGFIHVLSLEASL